MKKEIQVNHEAERAPVVKYIWSNLINFVSFILACLFCFYAVCYPIIINNPGFIKENETILAKKEELNLNLSLTLDEYKGYEEVIQNFYFVYYPDELVAYLTGNRNDKTIGELYNIFVLRLPASPTINSYSTDYASYYVNEDGTVNSSKPGFIKDGLNKRGQNDVLDLFKSTYKGLPSLLNYVDPSIKSSSDFISKTLTLGRICSIGFSFLVLCVALPILNKGRKGIGEYIFKISYGDKNGYRQKIGFTLLKKTYYLPFIALTTIFFNGYTVILLFILPYFINIMFLIFGNDRVTLVDKCSLGKAYLDDGSVLFKDEEEMNEYRKRALSNYTDKDFISKLSSFEASQESLD